MSSDASPVVEFLGVDKWFEPYSTMHLRKVVPGRFGEPTVREGLGTLALDAIELSIPPGQSVGIIGPNGAGKSTLLRVLADVYAPTEGWVRRASRLAAIIDLGVGFHPDLTGAENVRLAAALMAIPKAQMGSFVEQVVDFSGLEAVLDQPLKSYSTGMRARLGFAVATHSKPEVLAVDEALSVGDRQFQIKCLERIRTLVEDGVTLLFVTHDLLLVTQFCERALLLDHGRIIDDGDASRVVSCYLSMVDAARRSDHLDPAMQDISIRDVRVLTPEIDSGGQVVVEAHVDVGSSGRRLNIETALTFPPFGAWATNRQPLPSFQSQEVTLVGTTEPLPIVGRSRLGLAVSLMSGDEVVDSMSTEFQLLGEDARKPFAKLPLSWEWARGEAERRVTFTPEEIDHPVIRVTNLTKRFHDPHRHRLRNAIPIDRRSLDGAVALDDVTLDVAPGEFLGLIGPNGAGKSTLLKVIAGITRGQSGSVEVDGSLVSMIELGVGFHPDLTGRENLWSTGQLLGIAAGDLSHVLNEVIRFSGIEAAMDDPVKHYSTGMLARLGFSLACHVTADILLIDEMLSVGDAEFRNRAIERMHEINEAGTTIVLVSHDLRLVAEVCGRAALIVGGRLVDQGNPAAVIDRFGSSDLLQSDAEGRHNFDHSDSVRITDLQIEPKVIRTGGTVELRATVETGGPIVNGRIDLCVCEPIPIDQVRTGESNEIYDRTVAVETISTDTKVLAEGGRWNLEVSLTCEALRPGPVDLTILVVDELSGDILTEARRQLRIRGAPGSQPGLQIDTTWEVVGAS